MPPGAEAWGQLTGESVRVAVTVGLNQLKVSSLPQVSLRSGQLTLSSLQARFYKYNRVVDPSSQPKHARVVRKQIQAEKPNFNQISIKNTTGSKFEM